MKKFLAAVLAVMMIFSAFSVSAANEYKEPNYGYVNFWTAGKANSNQTVVSFKLNSGTITSGVLAYDIANNTFEHLETFSGDYYYMVPYTASAMVPGTTIQLPIVTAPSDWVFNGWSTPDGQIYVGGTSYTIPTSAAGTIIYFQADYSIAEEEEDTMGGVMSILVKVFGSIVGLMFFSDEYGSSAIEEGMQLVEKLIGGLFE